MSSEQHITDLCERLATLALNLGKDASGDLGDSHGLWLYFTSPAYVLEAEIVNEEGSHIGMLVNKGKLNQKWINKFGGTAILKSLEQIRHELMNLLHKEEIYASNKLADIRAIMTKYGITKRIL